MESRSRLKQGLARLFRPTSALLRSSCNSTASGSIFTSSATNSSARSLSTTATTVAPAFLSLGTNSSRSSNYNLDRSLSLSSSSRLLSTLQHCTGCRPAKSPSGEADVVSDAVAKGNARTKKKRMKKKERRVRETGEFYETSKREGMICPPVSPSSPSKDYGGGGKTTKIIRTRRKTNFSNAYGFSSSTSEGDDDDTDAFFASRSFSSDSSEFYWRPPSRNRKNKRKSSRRPPPRRGKKRTTHKEVEKEEEEEEIIRSGVPVMKRSSDPYVDFRDSMAEMIVEWQIFGAKDLGRLLHSYLSLNSPRHHAVILRAFADISDVLFGH